MTLLAATYALENMPVTDGNLHIVDLLQASELIPADVADELTLAIAEDYDGFNMHAELCCFDHLGRSHSRRLETILAA